MEQHQITAEPLKILPAASENKVNLSLATFNEYFVTKICQCYSKRTLFVATLNKGCLYVHFCYQL